MPDEETKINPLFMQLIISLQSAAWYQMGKTVSPISGKIERNLDEARISIDLLAMLQEKTRGNLLDEEKKILDNTVYTLQMNYVDELNKDKEAKEKGGKSAPADKVPESESGENPEDTGETPPENPSEDK